MNPNRERRPRANGRETVRSLSEIATVIPDAEPVSEPSQRKTARRGMPETRTIPHLIRFSKPRTLTANGGPIVVGIMSDAEPTVKAEWTR